MFIGLLNPEHAECLKVTAYKTFSGHKFRFFNSLTAWSAARAVNAM